jgi:hypothetical protein
MVKSNKQNGSGVFEGLWTGTAVFAAFKARDFTGFLKSYAWYSLILIVGLIVAFFIARTLGITEGFVQKIEKPSKEGDEKYVTPAGNVVMY